MPDLVAPDFTPTDPTHMPAFLQNTWPCATVAAALALGCVACGTTAEYSATASGAVAPTDAGRIVVAPMGIEGSVMRIPDGLARSNGGRDVVSAEEMEALRRQAEKGRWSYLTELEEASRDHGRAAELLTALLETVLLAVGGEVIQADPGPLLAEQSLALGDAFDAASAQKLGRLLGAETVVLGSWRLDGDPALFSAQGIDVESAETRFSISAESDDYFDHWFFGMKVGEDEDHPAHVVRFAALAQAFADVDAVTWRGSREGSVRLTTWVINSKEVTDSLSAAAPGVTPANAGLVGIVDFAGAQASLVDRVAHGLVRGGFRTLERQRLDSLQSRQVTESSDAYDEESIAELGKLLGADAVLTGRLTSLTLNDYTRVRTRGPAKMVPGARAVRMLHARLVRVEDGRVLWSSVHYSSELDDGELVEALVDELSAFGS